MITTMKKAFVTKQAEDREKHAPNYYMNHVHYDACRNQKPSDMFMQRKISL